MRNIRNMSAKVYSVKYVSTVSGDAEIKSADLTISSASKQRKAICEIENATDAQIAIISVTSSVVHYQIPDFNAAVAAGYIVEIEDAEE